MEYGINDIDDHGCLKPGFAMHLAAFLLARQLFYYPLSLLASRRGRGSSGANIDMSFIQVYSVWEFIACVPAVVVLVVLFKRKPEAGDRVRLLWSKARLLLIAAASLQLAALLPQLIQHGPGSTFFVVNLLLGIYLLIYVSTSKRIADAVSQFPHRKQS